MISAEQVQATFANLGRLRAAGLYDDALAYHDLGDASNRRSAGSTTRKPGTDLVATLEPNGSPAAVARHPEVLLPIERLGERTAGRAPICPVGHADSAARGVRHPRADVDFKEATVYRVGESYLGKDVWAMDLMPPIEATHWSQAKQTTMKPTVSIRRGSMRTKSRQPATC